MGELTIEKIRELCTEETFKRAKNYLDEGRVLSLERSGNEIVSKIRGDKDYEVNIRMSEPNFTAQCTCPSDWGGYCKHIVATLIRLAGNNKEIVMEEEKEREIDPVLNGLEVEELRDFLREELSNNPELKDRFLIHFTGKAAKRKSIHDYKKEIDMLYKEAAGSDGWIEFNTRIDFHPLTEKAEKFEDVENFNGAAKIYRALFEKIEENMHMVDDSGGHYGFEFSRQLDNYISCVKEIATGHADRENHLRNLLEKYLETEFGFIRNDIESAIWKLCESERDFEYLEASLSPHVPSNMPSEEEDWSAYHESKELIKLELNLLSEFKRGSELLKSAGEYYKEGPELCLYLSKKLEEKGRIKEAKSVAEDGLESFPSSGGKSIRLFLKELREK